MFWRNLHRCNLFSDVYVCGLCILRSLGDDFGFNSYRKEDPQGGYTTTFTSPPAAAVTPNIEPMQNQVTACFCMICMFPVMLCLFQIHELAGGIECNSLLAVVYINLVTVIFRNRLITFAKDLVEPNQQINPFVNSVMKFEI